LFIMSLMKPQSLIDQKDLLTVKNDLVWSGSACGK